MADLMRIEIREFEGDGHWQWIGALSKKHVELLCKIADDLSDADTSTAGSNE